MGSTTQDSAEAQELQRADTVGGQHDRKQTTMSEHYKRQSRQEFQAQVRREHRTLERRRKKQRRQGIQGGTRGRRAQHVNDRTIGITSQNVRGLATHMSNLDIKLQGFKEQHAHGNRDVIFLQETHLNPLEHAAAARQHTAMWGFKRTEAERFSFWASGESRKAGVAILVNPYGAVHNMNKWKEEVWSEHLIMTMGDIEGRQVLFINVYAPVNGAARVLFFKSLTELELPEGVDIVCGGDFNCVLDARVDRTRRQAHRDLGARELLRFLEKAELVDAGSSLVPRDCGDAARQQYAQLHHTYFHETGNGMMGSSRIDRFYIGAAVSKYVRGVAAEEPLCRTDHRAVLLELHSPTGPVRVTKRSTMYPPPAYVAAATQSLNQELIGTLGQTIEQYSAVETIQAWHSFKPMITEQMRKLKKDARKRMTEGFRLKIKRIKSSLRRLQHNECESEQRKQLLDALHALQDSRRVLRRRVVVARTEWSAKATTKAFYKRICTKFGDNTIKTLTPRGGSQTRAADDYANILRDAWEDIFNGSAEDSESRQDFIQRCSRRWEKVDLSDLDKAITEDEVRDAIGACKAGKACGPDQLSNEWYRDHCELLVPVLTKLYNSCMDAGQTPSSFLEAFIFSISKEGEADNPLNYRPIALLNTDYKVFTRILAWRVRYFVERLVNNRQCGFVPGRTIHEVIDLMEAAKAVCREDREMTEAQVLMLDFAKAYDSLDRTFLIEVLRAKGFQPKILKVISAMHENTSAQFLANGLASETLRCTSGIRQGCPLAPLLFIIAVDLLYDEIEADERLEGISLGGECGVRRLKIAGYADDTAIYITQKSMQRAAIQVVQRFSAVSGLKLNIKKSVALNLAGHSNRHQIPEAPRQPTSSGPAQMEADQMQEVESCRYLGHIVGTDDTTAEAWARAFEALRVRLALAVVKTNTVQQRAMIAAAIIVPKMMYVARHAWPTDVIVKKADRCIRNYVWNSTFREPERSVQGWCSTTVAGSSKWRGGAGNAKHPK